MIDSPRVDIIIPTFNSADTIRDSVDSVLAQTHKNVRVIIVDDGSTDDTEKIIREITDERVQYVKQENAGVSAARNRGFRESTAPYVAYLDADDTWMKDKLEKQLELFRQNPNLGLVYGSHTIINATGQQTGELTASKRGWIFNDLLRGNCIVGSASMVLVRADVMREVGEWNTTLRGGEDWEIWLRIARKYQIDFVPELIAAIRVVETSAQHNYEAQAESLSRLPGIITSEFKLTGQQKKTVKLFCFMSACTAYLRAGDFKKTRKILWMILVIDPGMIFNYRNWEFLSTVILGERGLRFIVGIPEKRSPLFRSIKTTKRLIKNMFSSWQS